MSQNELKAHAKMLWTDPYMMKEWMRAVQNVRQSKRGWVLDKDQKQKHESTS